MFSYFVTQQRTLLNLKVVLLKIYFVWGNRRMHFNQIANTVLGLAAFQRSDKVLLILAHSPVQSKRALQGAQRAGKSSSAENSHILIFLLKERGLLHLLRGRQNGDLLTETKKKSKHVVINTGLPRI